MTEIQTAIATSIVLGAIATALVQIIKKYFGTNKIATYGVVAVISLVVAYLYGIVAKNSDLIGVFVQTLAYAGAIYTFVVSKFKGASTNS